ncbi:MAG: RHS repeat-associated core domain-containing protein, partial [Bacteroidales bacterium]|nr:RHS repeat-associated core domain-containing protein [Bacteroidales bacterium]
MQSVNYLYAANGQKLRKQTRIDHQLAATYDYAGRFIYSDLNGDDTELSYLMANQGRIILHEDGSSGYEYSIKDHLGNTRITFDEKGKILQEDTYYPFGMNISGLSYNQNTIQNKYKYNGKELQDGFGLDWYDYHARFYDPSIGRFTTVDPMAESYYGLTGYNYVANNPIRLIDPDGMMMAEIYWLGGNSKYRPIEGDYVKSNGKVIGNDGINDDKVHLVT